MNKEINKILIAGTEYDIRDSSVDKKVKDVVKENTYSKAEIDKMVGDVESVLRTING